MPEKLNDNSLENNILKVFKAAIIFALVIIFAYAFTFKAGLSNDHQRWSEFGSFIGGTVGSLISFFAFFALLLTIILQNKAIRVSKEELALTREELAKTSASAESQAHHFIAQAKIDDLLQSVNQIEETIRSKSHLTLPVFDDRQVTPTPMPLEYFLKRDMGLISHFAGANKDMVEHADLRPEEIGSLFELLFGQLMLLKEIPEAKNRYRVLMHRNLETFFLLSRVGALPFDWLTPLDEQSKTWIKVYERNLRSYQLRDKKQRGE